MSTIASFYEPFFSFADVDNILEETFTPRSNATFERQNNAPRFLKPRRVLFPNLLLADVNS
jgi:hypothetical protein